MMKKYLSWFLYGALALSSCEKEKINLLEDPGCISRVTIPVGSQGTLSNADFKLVDSLFTVNKINKSFIRYLGTYRDSTKMYDGTYDERKVTILQYTNNLPIFSGDLNYLFKNGRLSYVDTTRLTKGTTLTTNPTLTSGQVRKLFLDDMEHFDYRAAYYQDSCFQAEFGYYDLNSGISNKEEKLVKAWHVTIPNYAYPEAYYQDDSGERIYYDNGITSLK